MAIKWMNHIWEERKDLEGSELLCALAIADHADNNGQCFPGLQTIAAKLRCSKRQVTRLIAALEAKKVFSVVRHFGRGQQTTFQFLKGDIHDTYTEAGKGDTQDTFVDSEKVTSEVIKGDKSGKEKVTNPARHYINHSSLTEEEPGEEETPAIEAIADEIAIQETEAAFNIRLDVRTKKLVSQSVPRSLVSKWPEFIKGRAVPWQRASDREKLVRIGYALTDFQKDNRAHLTSSQNPDADCSHCKNSRRVYVNDDSVPCIKCRPAEEKAFWRSRGKIAA